ncbi:MAG: rRNA cytosine-C5-methylase, partial [Alistipes sp.]|nr:rRNA cytosine-C5-methylase [Alistipes sp.]
MELNEVFIRRVLRDLGADEGRALCEALDTPSPVAVRLHPDKTGLSAGTPTADALRAAVATLPDLTFDWPVAWSPSGCYLAERPSFTLDSDFHAGAYYVQEPSSQFVGHLLRNVPTDGARILDLCAAPGGKTTLYASLAGVGGLVVANEIDRRRAAVLADNVRKWGIGNTVVTVGEPRQLGDCEGMFDVVAV